MARSGYAPGIVHFASVVGSALVANCDHRVSVPEKLTENPRLVTCARCRRWIRMEPADRRRAQQHRRTGMGGAP